MSILSQNPHDNPNAFKNKTVDINNGNSKSDNYDELNNKIKCVSFIDVLRKFINKLIDKYLDDFKLVNRIPVQFLSEEDERGYVIVKTLLGEIDHNFKALNKSGEIISRGEFGYLEYRKSPTNGWIAMRNGTPKVKGFNENGGSNSNGNNKCFTLITEENWNKMVYDKTIDENMIYVFIDDDEEIY